MSQYYNTSYDNPDNHKYVDDNELERMRQQERREAGLDGPMQNSYGAEYASGEENKLSDYKAQYSNVLNDPLLVLTRLIVLILMFGSAYSMPSSLMPIWLTIVGLVVVGGVGLELFYAWIMTSRDAEDERLARRILVTVSVLFSAVLVGLLLVLGYKGMQAMKLGRSAESSDQNQTSSSEIATTYS